MRAGMRAEMRVAAHARFRRDAAKARAGSSFPHPRASSGFGRFFISAAAPMQQEHARIR
jgi:hypothetical protein